MFRAPSTTCHYEKALEHIDEGMKTETPGEIRGASIKNGVRKSVSAGDVVHIPAKMPHQFFLEPGKQITYFVVKVNSL